MRTYLAFGVLCFALQALISSPSPAEDKLDTVLCYQQASVDVEIPAAIEVDAKAIANGDELELGDLAYFRLTDQLVASGECYDLPRGAVVFTREDVWCSKIDSNACFVRGPATATLPPEVGGGTVTGYAFYAVSMTAEELEANGIGKGNLPAHLLGRAGKVACVTVQVQTATFTLDDGGCQ